jgi:hypothetical protein
MRQILIAVGIALTFSILLTPVLIRLFTRQGFGTRDPRGRAAEPPQEARHTVDGWRSQSSQASGRDTWAHN